MMNQRVFRFVILLLLSVSVLPAYARDGAIEDLRETGKAFAAIAHAVSPSVVFIQAEGKVPVETGASTGTPFGDEFLRRFFGEQFQGMPQRHGFHQHPQAERHMIGEGSGFVFSTHKGLLSHETYILTNNHVVENADKLRVTFQDGREFDAKVTGSDPQSDVAVVEIDTAGLPALKLADSSKLEVGEWVVAIGNPFGLSNTLTVGVVSATDRTSLGIADYEDFIQTDAAINPGNSGGPLVNLDGEVVGINTAIFSRSGGYMGVGLAIPSNLAKTVATQLIETGTVTRGYLGILIQPLTPELAESFDLKSREGILVAQVSEDSPAAKAGLQQGDVIVAYQGHPVKEVGSFRNEVALTPPGNHEQLTIVRAGREQNLEVTIGKLGKESSIVQGSVQSDRELGLTVQTLTPELAAQFNAKSGEGVVVTAVQAGSIAAMAGIEPGTVIFEVNHKRVSNAAEFKRALGNSSDKRVLLLIGKDDAQRFVVLNW